MVTAQLERNEVVILVFMQPHKLVICYFKVLVQQEFLLQKTLTYLTNDITMNQMTPVTFMVLILISVV